MTYNLFCPFCTKMSYFPLSLNSYFTSSCTKSPKYRVFSCFSQTSSLCLYNLLLPSSSDNISTLKGWPSLPYCGSYNHKHLGSALHLPAHSPSFLLPLFLSPFLFFFKPDGVKLFTLLSISFLSFMEDWGYLIHSF